MSEELRALLSGYAAGTLSAAEEKKLFAAALEDQEVFDALAEEQLMRETLAQPGARDVLLAALEGKRKRNWLPWAALAASVVGGVILLWPGGKQPVPVDTAPTELAQVKREPQRVEEPPVQAKKAPKQTATRELPAVAAAPATPEVFVADAEEMEKRKVLTAPAESTSTFASPMRARSENAGLTQYVYAFRIVKGEGGNVAQPIAMENPTTADRIGRLLVPKEDEEIRVLRLAEPDAVLDALVRAGRAIAEGDLPERAWQKIKSK